ncbi:MAG: primosomal protein N' [Gammaproteobacteria bacterium]|nr:primosomal protein N' [Gammaproteobacteria bacterium]
MTPSRFVLEVAVFAPLRQTFDYFLPAGTDPAIASGCRVRVPFGRGTRFGVVLACREDGARLATKAASEILDEAPVFDAEQLRLARWAADYYQHPLGEILSGMLPAEVRRGRAPREALRTVWRITDAGRALGATPAGRAHRRHAVLALAGAADLDAAALAALDFDARRAVRELEKLGALERVLVAVQGTAAHASAPLEPFHVLNADQERALAAVRAHFGGFGVVLLQGVTGSGKTEVYMQAMRELLAAGRQILMLVPEIALTQALVARFEARFGAAVGVLHSGLTDQARAQTWAACRRGELGILLGTRSAVWAPLPRLGLLVIDEEHDASYKQQDGLRYSARDVAVMRARQRDVPIVLGSATPSLESCLNGQRGRYETVHLRTRAGSAVLPRVRLLDIRGLKLDGGLSEALLRAIGERLARREQVLLFLNRRGFAPTVICHRCGWVGRCTRCDARLVWHKKGEALHCHHCGAVHPLSRPVPDHTCDGEPDLVPLGVGTERVAEALAAAFPGQRIARIDRDTMRGREAIRRTFEDIRARRLDIMIGTQMLAKGHDFSGITLVAVVDADSRLFSLDFRAEERFAQLLTQVGGRAGRAEAPGEVLVQTHHPEHPLFARVFGHGYEGFAAAALAEREAAALPPFHAMAMIRAEATDRRYPQQFLEAVAARLRRIAPAGLEVEGPVAAAMEKRAGKFRAQIVLRAPRRAEIAAALRSFVVAAEALPARRRVRWSLDVDPQDAL